MLSIDFNCDLGEGTGQDALLMPFISSANIACGAHAGDRETMMDTLELAIAHNLKIGAHPSFPDKTHFGRREMELPPEEVYESLTTQIRQLVTLAGDLGASIHHVKPHGALYNMAAKDIQLAKVIVQAIRDIDKSIVLYGLSGSALTEAAREMDLKCCNEVFADRAYREDGSLLPRSSKLALIEETDAAVSQALQLVTRGTVSTVEGRTIPLAAETLCIHGDGKRAVEFAKNIRRVMEENGVSIRAPF